MRFILAIVSGLFGRWIDSLVASLKTEAAAVYVAGVSKARKAFVALLGIALFLLLALAGFVFVHIALFVLLPWPLPVKALALMMLGLVYLGIGFAVVWELSSDRTWIKFMKVDRILAGLPPRK
ncbi:MAG: hypothetical protein R6X14_05940 [bacterium]